MAYFGKDAHRFTKVFLRHNLREWDYSNWDIETIQYALQDNWLRDELESMLRRGWKFQEAIDKLVQQGKIIL